MYLPFIIRVSNQGRTKEEPRNTLRTPNHQKVLFVKIALSFTSLIPCLKTPSDDRENTERTPTQLPASKKSTFLKIGFLKKLTLFLKKLSAFLKRLDSFPKTIDLSVFKEKSPQKSPFSCISQKKSVSLRPNIQKN